MLIIPGIVRMTGPLVLPSAADVERYAPPAPPADEFLSEDERGFPIVRKPVGVTCFPTRKDC